MSGGRTVWLPKDAAWWRRGYVVELGQEHGPAGPAVLDWLTCEAKVQGPMRGHDGSVKAAFSSIAHATFTQVEDVRAIIETAARVGGIDDLQVSDRTFTCRISGWEDDIEKPLAATRRAAQRAAATSGDNGRHETTEAGMSPDVPKRLPTGTSTGTQQEQQDARERATALHEHLPDVLDVLRAAPGLVVEELAVDSACRAHRDQDVIAAAHTVASWAHEGGLSITSASRLMHRALERQATDAAKRDAEVTRHTTRPTGTGRGPRGSAAGYMDRLQQMHAQAIAEEAATP